MWEVILVQKLYCGFENTEFGGAARILADQVPFGEVEAGCGRECRKCDVCKIGEREIPGATVSCWGIDGVCF